MKVISVPVEGGDLTVGVWEGASAEAPVVVAAHGITASHLSWAPVADALAGDVTLVAPDLRGRGASAGLPGPFGMRSHGRDLVAVMDALGVARAVVVGQSMGGYVANAMAVDHPTRVARVVLVDGGLALRLPEGFSTEELLNMVVGPAVARLSMTFESRDAYRSFWKQHPAIGPWWSPEVEAYVDYDLVGSDAEGWRSRVSAQAVHADSESNLADPWVATAVEQLPCPADLLRAERGMLNEGPPGLFPDDLVAEVLPRAPQLHDLGVVPDTNHYTILLAPHGAAAIADAVRKAVAATS